MLSNLSTGKGKLLLILPEVYEGQINGGKENVEIISNFLVWINRVPSKFINIAAPGGWQQWAGRREAFWLEL